MALAFNGLSAYTKQLVKPLLTSAVFDAKTQQLILASGIVIPNVKSSVAIPLMETDAVFAAQSCSFDASGTTTFSQRTITVGKIKVEEKICPKDMEAYFTQEALKAGSTYEDFGNSDFQKAYLDKKNVRIAAQLETAIWQGSLLSADGNLNKFKGFIRHSLEASASIIAANASTYISGGPVASITSANVIDVFDAVYLAIPAKVVAAEDMTIFCGQDLFRMYTIALKNSKVFNYQVDVKADAEFILPGTSIKVIAVAGLNGTNKIYAMRLSNMFLGTDLLNEEEKFEIFYAKEADEVRYVSEFKFGVNFAFPDEWVEFKL